MPIKDRVKRLAYQKEYYANNKERFRNRKRVAPEVRRGINRRYWLKSEHGITVEQYKAKLSLQDNKCSVCLTKLSKVSHKSNSPHVDHDHKTGVLRDILCSRCNQALGLLDEDAGKLQSMIDYVERWSAKL